MSCRFLFGGSFLRYAGRGVLGGFFMWKLSEGCSWGEADLLRRVVRERPGVYLFPRGVLLGLDCSICGVLSL